MAIVPEKFNLHVALGGAEGHVQVMNKVEGDIEIVTKRGNITAAKLR